MTRTVAPFVIGLAASALAQGIALAHLVTGLRDAPWDATLRIEGSSTPTRGPGPFVASSRKGA
jgi:hypothetical protein